MHQIFKNVSPNLQNTLGNNSSTSDRIRSSGSSVLIVTAIMEMTILLFLSSRRKDDLPLFLKSVHRTDSMQ